MKSVNNWRMNISLTIHTAVVLANWSVKGYLWSHHWISWCKWQSYSALHYWRNFALFNFTLTNTRMLFVELSQHNLSSLMRQLFIWLQLVPLFCVDTSMLKLPTPTRPECVNTVSLCFRLQYCQSCQSVDFPSLLCLHMPSAACAHAQ